MPALNVRRYSNKKGIGKEMNWYRPVKSYMLALNATRHFHSGNIWKDMNWSTLEKSHIPAQNATRHSLFLAYLVAEN